MRNYLPELMLRLKAVYQRQNEFFGSMILTRYASTITDVDHNRSQPKPISEMPGLKSYPVIGSMLTLMTRKDFVPQKFHLLWENISKEYGQIFQFKIPTFPSSYGVVVTNPDEIAELHRLTMENPVREIFHSLEKVRKENPKNYFENRLGIVVENNEEWWRVRSKVQTPLMKPKNILKYLPKMDEVTLTFMDRIAEFQSLHGEMPKFFLDELYKWALESVGLVALNRRLGCLEPNLPPDSEQMQMIRNANAIFEALNDIDAGFPLWRIFPTPSYRKLKNAHEAFLRVADEKITENEKTLESNLERREEEGLTLMETLLRTEGLSRKDVVTMMLDMLFAGIDTTANSLAFTLYCLARNPEAQKRIQQEVDSILGDGREILTEAHLARLSYTKACVKESMRMFPVVLGTSRKLSTDIELGGYLVPKGSQVIVLNSVTCKDEYFFPQANKYIPERWGREKPLGPIHPFASLPFSYGSRMCIGRRIAEQEMYTFLARVMHRFNIEYKYEDIEILFRKVCVPSRPLRFEFRERR